MDNPINPNYLFMNDVVKEVDIPKNGILSRTLFGDEKLKVIVFGFDTGQELSEHTASCSAIIHILQGDARLTLGGDVMEVHAGAWARMTPNLKHAIFAHTPLVMLLLTLQ